MDSFADTEVTRSWTQWRIALGRSYRFVYNGGQELSVVCRGPRSHPRLERRPFSREIVDLSIDCNSQLTGEDAPFDGDIDIHDFHALPINPQLTQVTTTEPSTSLSPISELASTTSTSENSDLVGINSISPVEPSRAQLKIEVLVMRKYHISI